MYTFSRLLILAIALLVVSVRAHAAPKSNTVVCFFESRAVHSPIALYDYVQKFRFQGTWNGTSATLALSHTEYDSKLMPSGLYAIDTSVVVNSEDDIPATEMKMVNNSGKFAAFAPTERYDDGNFYNPSFTIDSAAAVVGAKGRFTGVFTVYQQTDDRPYKLTGPMSCVFQ